MWAMGAEREDNVRAEAKIVYPKFWKRFCEKCGTIPKKMPTTGHYVGIPSSVEGVWFAFVVTLRKGARLELYVDKHDECENAAIFGKLKARRAEIERAGGAALVWHDGSKMGERRRRIDLNIETPGIADEGEWNTVIAAFLDIMPRFRNKINELIK